jgi:NAD(P)-dependent dehydrogenase (short-subunit alcohol dehydrogenase family)
MKTIVITGSSRGIGYGLAFAFLERGCNVVISGRSESTTRKACERLRIQFEPESILGIPCDVRVYEQVVALWDGAVANYGQVDIWINNAGLSGPIKLVQEQEVEIISSVIETNLNGVIYGFKVAMSGMLLQGFGQIYNMEGMGSDGRKHVGLTLYGTTKCAQKYLNDSLAEETRSTPVIVGALRPGMVATDLIVSQYRKRPEDWERVKRIFNIIAEKVDVVSPWFVDKILINQKNGVRINYLSRWKLLKRMLSIPFSKRDVFSDFGL